VRKETFGTRPYRPQPVHPPGLKFEQSSGLKEGIDFLTEIIRGVRFID